MPVYVEDHYDEADGGYSQALSDAVDELGAAGGEVILPAGELVLSRPERGGAALFFEGKNNVLIRGEGPATRLKFNAPYEAKIMSFVDCENIHIRDLAFDAGVAVGRRVAYSQALDFRGCVDSSVRFCWIGNTGNLAVRVSHHGIGWADKIPNGSRQSERVTIQNNTFYNCNGTGAVNTKSGGASGLKVLDNDFMLLGVTAVSIESENLFGVTEVPSERFIVSRNIVDGVDADRNNGTIAWGLSVTELATFGVVSDNIVSNVVGTTSAAGLFIQGLIVRYLILKSSMSICSFRWAL